MFVIFNIFLGESFEYVYIFEWYIYGKINYWFDEKSICYIIIFFR